jgi:hypothetical protein
LKPEAAMSANTWSISAFAVRKPHQ